MSEIRERVREDPKVDVDVKEVKVGGWMMVDLCSIIEQFDLLLLCFLEE